MSSKWTNRLISKAAKLSRRDSDQSTDGGANDFLYGAGGAPPPSVPRSVVPRVQLPAQPVLDLADNDQGLGEPLPEVNPAYALPPVRKGKGIHVGFSETQPVVIGEGGDEADLPTSQVSRNAGVLPAVRVQDAAAPSSGGRDFSELHMNIEDEGNSLGRSATKKPGVGPGWLQKRKSFNMEEGQIQRTASSTEMDSVAARQGFGATLDPNAALQQAVQPVPPPPSGAMDRPRERHTSPMQSILRAAAGNIAHQNDPPPSAAASRWDELLAHPTLKRPTLSPQLSSNDIHDPQAPSSQHQLPSPSPNPFQSKQSVAAPPDARPPAHMSGDAHPGGFRRGISPTRPSAENPTVLPVISPGQAPQPPDSTEYSPYSPISNTIDRLMPETQSIALGDRWGPIQPPEAYQPSGYTPQRQVHPAEQSNRGEDGLSARVARQDLYANQSDTRVGDRDNRSAADAMQFSPQQIGRRPSELDAGQQFPPQTGRRPSELDAREPRGPMLIPNGPPHSQDPFSGGGRSPGGGSPHPYSREGLSPSPNGRPEGPAGPRPPPSKPQFLPRPNAPSPHQEPTVPVLPPVQPLTDQTQPARGRTESAANGNYPHNLGVPMQSQRSRSNSSDAPPVSGSSINSNPSPVQELDSRSTTNLAPAILSPKARSPVRVYSPSRDPERSPARSQSQRQDGHDSHRASFQGDFDACIHTLEHAFRQAEVDARAFARNDVAQWLRFGAWWNLKGRKAFELRIKEHNESVAARSSGVDESLKQPFIDVAKAWWIVERVLPPLLQNHSSSPTRPHGLDHESLDQAYQALRLQVETFISSVSRRRLLPPVALLNINFTSFMADYPPLPAAVRALTAGMDQAVDDPDPTDRPFFGIVLADTSRHFSYGHLFAETQVTLPHDDDEEDDDLILPCVISLIRDKSTPQMEMVISSQDAQVDLRIRANGKVSPTWAEVELRPRSHSVKIQLMTDFDLVIRLEKEDFKTLWGIREYNKKVIEEWSPAMDERLIYETRLYDFNYIPPKGGVQPLPTNPIKNCAMRLYEQVDLNAHSESGRGVYRGHRMVVITAPGIKTLSIVSVDLDRNFPVLHNLLRGEGGMPALLLFVSQNEQPFRIIPAFHDAEDRTRFSEKLSGSYLAADEVNLGTMKVTNISVSTAVPGTPGNLLDIPGLRWDDIHILSKMEGGVDPRHSDRFRITADSEIGRLVDRPIVKPGELKIGLDSLDLNSIKLRRSQDSSLIVALMESKLPTGMTPPLQDAFKKKSTAASTIRYQFPSMPDMHEFQEIVSGFHVHYDGIASYFSIKGQLKAAGLHKKFEATRTRIQIVQEEKKNVLQLLAFFKDMPDGGCMSFQLASTDTYEASHVSGKYFVRFVDAKFSMPKALSEADAMFVSLDMPEFASERDDIMVGFEKDEDRDALLKTLPAAPTKAHGLASFKRFVELGKTGARPGSRSSQH